MNDSPLPMAAARILEALARSWSRESSSQWSPENLARGQCNVTALVVQDAFGGDLLKTAVAGESHFYNRIGSEVFDFTAAQFSEPLAAYDDLPATRDEVMAGTTPRQYQSLRRAFQANAGLLVHGTSE